MSLRDRLRGQPPRTEPVVFPADRVAWAAAHLRLQEAGAELVAASQRTPYPPAHLVEAERAAQEAVDELSTRRFEVRALAPKDWEALKSQHPPVGANPDELDYDPDGFYPAALAETVTLATPDGPESSTEAEWHEILADPEVLLNTGEQNVLINMMLQVNTHAVVVPAVGKGSAQTRS